MTGYVRRVTTTRRVEFVVDRGFPGTRLPLGTIQEAIGAALAEVTARGVARPTDRVHLDNTRTELIVSYELTEEDQSEDATRRRLAAALDEPDAATWDELVRVAGQRREWFDLTWATGAGLRSGNPLDNPPIPALLPRDWPEQVAALVDAASTDDRARLEQLCSLVDAWVDAWVLAATREDT